MEYETRQKGEDFSSNQPMVTARFIMNLGHTIITV